MIATLALAPAVVQAQDHVALAGPVRTAMVSVSIGKSQDVRTDQSFADVVVGDASVADVNPLTDHSLSILGKKPGTTRVTVYGTDKKPVGVFDIEVSYDVSQLSREIDEVGGRGIKVSSVNGRIMLSGTAPDAATLDKAMQMAVQFAPDLRSVINTVQVVQQQQVILEVRFLEVDRSASRELGVQWSGGSSASDSGKITVGTGGLLSGNSPFGVLVGTLSSGNTSLNATLSALEQRGLARSLAEPNLVALSGETASFLAGGTFYIPVASSTGTPSASPVNYGVGLAFTPTVLKDGLIDLIIKPEVSQIDTAHSETIGGTSVPGLITRKASTTLELRDGQTFMLGGLLQNTSNATQSLVPW
ncbi:MAG TPA: type II and III secretion system protein family protein, partial [Paraburkholderia sp.]|nr:type II and III secretion system protein family protein [Paraburkholderia sp.]